MRFPNLNSKIEWIYRIMFFMGMVCLVLDRKNFTLENILLRFPIAAVLAGSYFWIRLDVWRSVETIEKMSNSGDGLNESVKEDLVGRKVDSRVALFLIVMAALAQALLLGREGAFIFIGVLLILVSLAHWITCLCLYRIRLDNSNSVLPLPGNGLRK